MAVYDISVEGKRALQEAAGARHVAAFDQPADLTRRDNRASNGYRRDHLGDETKPRSQLAQQARIARAFVAEPEIPTHQHGFCAERIDQYLSHELFGSELRQLRRKGKDQ